MTRRALQPSLPRLEADGRTHQRECECPRCDAGFRPSEKQRQDAAERWQEQQAREAAARLQARRLARNRIKTLRLTLALEEDERRTNAHLRAQAELRARLQSDPRLDALLASRRAGRVPDDALAEAERRFPPKPSDR